MGSCLVQLTEMNQGVTTRSVTTVEALVKYFYSFEVAKMCLLGIKSPNIKGDADKLDSIKLQTSAPPTHDNENEKASHRLYDDICNHIS